MTTGSRPVKLPCFWLSDLVLLLLLLLLLLPMWYFHSARTKRWLWA
jgi:hypothetical protein